VRRRPGETSEAADEPAGGARTVDLRRPERSTKAPAAAADTSTLNGPPASNERLDTHHQRDRQSGARRYE
jgi:hypothetical protein